MNIEINPSPKQRTAEDTAKAICADNTGAPIDIMVLAQGYLDLLNIMEANGLFFEDSHYWSE